MESIELSRLEAQVSHLLRVLDDLRVENKYLRNQLARHAREKSGWYQHKRDVASKINKIVSNLQEALV